MAEAVTSSVISPVLQDIYTIIDGLIMELPQDSEISEYATRRDPKIDSKDPPAPDFGHIMKDLAESPRQSLIKALRQDIPEPGELWAQRDLKPMLDGTKVRGTDGTETTPTDSRALEKERRVLEYKNLLTDIERYNHSGALKGLPQHLFATTEGDTEWIRERMKDKWARRHETHAWQMYNTELGEEYQSRLGKGDIWGEAGREEEQRKAKHKAAREANKRMWAECEVAVLDEWKKTLGHGDYKDQIQELKRLQILLDIQNAEISSRTTNPYGLASKASSRLDSLVRVANDHLESLDKVEAVEDINDKSRKIMRRVHTRVGRLMAQDVQDKAAREEEIRRRLRHTAALDFMLDAWTDLDTMKRIVHATRKNLEEMEADLECVSLAAVDTVSALKDWRLAMAFQKE